MLTYQTTPYKPVNAKCGAATSQSKAGSFIEALANVAIGYGVALATQLAVFPMFGLDVDLGQNMAIGGIFTVVSIVRSYAVRRVFNRIKGG